MKFNKIEARLITRVLSVLEIGVLVFQASCARPSPTVSLTPEASIPTAGLVTFTPSPTPTPTFTLTETPTPTFTPTETPKPTPTEGPYESLTKINPSKLTNESFLNAMPANIKATHENSSTATQEQKDAHDKWLVDAWKAIFSNLTDEQLAGMNLKRADIASLDFARTGKTYTQNWIHGVGTYPIYDYSLLQAVKAFSQEFNFNEPTMMINFWEALKAKVGGNWSKYLWQERYGREGFNDWSFHYAIDGTIFHDIPIPGLEGVIADMAVRAYYYDVNGNEQTTLIAKVLKLPDGTLLNPLNQTTTRAEIDQNIKKYPHLYDLGSVPGIGILAEEENVIKLFPGKYLELPGVQAYLKFIKANKTDLEKFLKTGSPTLKIIIPMAEGGSGGYNILHDNPNVGPPTPTP